MRAWLVAGAFLVFGAGLVHQFSALTRALAAGYPAGIGGELTREFDGLARIACVVGGVLLVALLPMVLRRWPAAAVATVVLAVPFVALGVLLRTWPLVAGAVVAGVVAAFATRSPATTTPSGSPAPAPPHPG